MITTVAWDAVLTQCGGVVLETALAFYMVVAGLAPVALQEVARTVELSASFEHAALLPGEVLYMRVHAVDVAGNSSEDCR
jgi:hypothetical protein